MSESEITRALERMKGTLTKEALIISTCNRTELYAIPANEEVTSDYLVELLLSAKGISHEETASLKSGFERLTYCDAITHLFRVISGTESQIIGDQQIFAQVKEAFRIANEAGSSGGFLTKLAHSAFRVAKRTISETALTTGAATISYAAVEFSRKVYDNLRNHHALIIGAGEMAELAAKHLAEKHVGRLSIANRNVDHAREVLNRVRGERAEPDDMALSLSDLPSVLSSVDIVISSTRADGYVLHRSQLSEALSEWQSSYPLVLIDIAVPRDIDPEIGTLPNVFLKDIDDLRSIVDRNLERRKAELPKADAIVREELDTFLASISRLEVGPTIAELRSRFEAVRQEELARHKSKLDEKTFAMMDDMTRRMMNRLLHAPTISLKDPHGDSDDLLTRIDLVRQLFALDLHDLGESYQSKG